jgi:amphi-Trp domain-containing protein
MAKNEFQHESLQDRKTIVEYLQALQEGFANGTLTLSDQDEELVLKPGGPVRLEIGATRKRGRTRITLRFDWKETNSKGTNGGMLRINGDLE